MSTIVRSVSCASLACVVVAGLAGVAMAETRPVPLGVVGGAAVHDPKPRSTYMIFDAAPGHSSPVMPSAIEHAAPTVIYMNKNGGTYSPGNNDARTNRSSIPSRTARIAAWQVSSAGWQQVMTCMRAQFARFNVTVTDVDPGTVPHIESVVAGSPQDVGMGDGVGGVSPFTSDCSTIPNSIVFTFAEVYGTAYRDICETAAQEVSHSFGLDHEFECKDPMTYLTGCGVKEFQNVAARCGEYSARTCKCGGSTQNSVTMLTSRLGAANSPPVVAITQPAAGATVAPGFAIAVNASDAGTVQRVELWIDGALVTTDTTAPWTFTAPASVGDGAHTVEARAIDDGMATTASSVTVTVRTPSGGGGGPGPDAGTGGGGGGDADAGDTGGAGGGGASNDAGTAGPNDSSAEVTGGCATGSGGTGAGTFLLVAMGGLTLIRRRRCPPDARLRNLDAFR